MRRMYSLRALLHFRRQALEEIAAAQRIGHVRHAAFVRDHLLRAQRDGHGVLARQRVGFIERIGVQRLRPAQHRRQRLQRGPHDVVVGLLPGERAAGRLRVGAQLPAALVLGAVAIAHGLGPDLARGAILGDLLEEIVVRVEEEAEPRREAVDGAARARAPTPHTPCRRAA